MESAAILSEIVDDLIVVTLLKGKLHDHSMVPHQGFPNRTRQHPIRCGSVRRAARNDGSSNYVEELYQ